MAVLIKESRNKAVDLLKIIALFHMMSDHIYVTLLKTGEAGAFITFLYNIIPLCPALFLFLSGYSLTLREGYRKIRKRIIYGIILIFLAASLFFVEYGIQLPDLLISSGILNTIGLNLIICTLIGTLPWKQIAALFLFLGATILFVLLRLFHSNIIPLTWGYEPILPTILFGFAGFAFGLIKKKHVFTKKAMVIITIVLLSLFIILSMRYGFLKPLYPDTGRYTVERVFKVQMLPENLMIHQSIASFYHAYIWNYDIICFFYALLILLLLILFCEYSARIGLLKLPSFLLQPAQYLIFNYLLHLGIIGLTTLLTGYGIFDKYAYSFYYAGLIIIIYTTNSLLTLLKKHRYQGISPE